MMRVCDKSGQRYGRLVVLSRADNTPDGKVRWLCQCDCGATVVKRSAYLKHGVNSSCGCYVKERAKKLAQSHRGACSPRWKGGRNSAHCRCVAALAQSRGKAKREGHVPCNAPLEELVATVVDKCQLCGVPEMELTTKLCLDHDHETGQFRGWLCHRCNRLVGMVEAYQQQVNQYLDNVHV